jgi:hypothetical protein
MHIYERKVTEERWLKWILSFFPLIYQKNVIDIIDSNPTTTNVTHDALTAMSARLGKYCGARFTIQQLN